MNEVEAGRAVDVGGGNAACCGNAICCGNEACAWGGGCGSGENTWGAGASFSKKTFDVVGGGLAQACFELRCTGAERSGSGALGSAKASGCAV